MNMEKTNNLEDILHFLMSMFSQYISFKFTWRFYKLLSTHLASLKKWHVSLPSGSKYGMNMEKTNNLEDILHFLRLMVIRYISFKFTWRFYKLLSTRLASFVQMQIYQVLQNMVFHKSFFFWTWKGQTMLMMMVRYFYNCFT